MGLLFGKKTMIPLTVTTVFCFFYFYYVGYQFHGDVCFARATLLRVKVKAELKYCSQSDIDPPKAIVNGPSCDIV